MKALRQVTSCIFHASLLIMPALVEGAPTSTYTYGKGSTTTSIRSTTASVSPVVPIGFSDEPNARADGRLFNINGKTQYFAGMYYTDNSRDLLLTKTIKEPTPTGWDILRTMPMLILRSSNSRMWVLTLTTVYLEEDSWGHIGRPESYKVVGIWECQ